MKRLTICAAALALAGCGGDFCSSDVGTLAGTWEVVLDVGGDKSTASVTIDESGDVKVTTSDGTGWSCDLLDDALCALKIHCVAGNDDFTLTLTRK